MGISLNKQKSMYNILTPSILAIKNFLWTCGGSGHIYYIYIIYARGLVRVKLMDEDHCTLTDLHNVYSCTTLDHDLQTPRK